MIFRSVDGTFSFTYTGAATSGVSSEQPSPVPSVIESESASPEPSDVVSAVAIATPVIAAPTAVAYDAAPNEAPKNKTWIYLGVFALVIIAGGLVYLRRKK